MLPFYLDLKHEGMKQKKKVLLYGSIATVILFLGLLYWFFFASFSAKSGESYVYIDNDDTPDSVYAKLEANCQPRQLVGLKICGALLNYKEHIHSGRYATGNGISTVGLIRNLRGGHQEPVTLVIPVVHTINDLAKKLELCLQADSTQWMNTILDPKMLQSMEVDTATAICLFLPNSYEVYWDIAPEKLLQRMKKEHDAFWTETNVAKANAAGLTPDEVYTLASIVEQESANEAERPIIAGMYLNRLHKGMRLQADPTVKFALGDFGLRRILHAHLTVDSPYNTYKYEGLPPGPICIPSLNAINAVLNYAHHDYLYMCAKEDFSGSHNFAVTYSEHMANARRYAEALNERGIR